MDPVVRQYCVEALEQLRAAPGSDGAIARALASRLGVSVRTAYRHLDAVGWKSGRKTRADKGRSQVDDDAARVVAALTASGRDKRGRPNLPVEEARRIAQEQGLIPEVSTSTVLRKLNQMGLGPEQMLSAELGTSRISRHPNHCWQVDFSPCLQWYIRDDAGRRIDPYADGGVSFYRGKSQLPKKKLWRYVATDHYSGAYFVRFYWAEGENSLDLVDFLWHAFAEKRLHRAFPFRGLPRRIVADQGAPFKSMIVQNLLKALEIGCELHAAGNAKATGGVEARHFHWQRRFDARLKLQPARNLAELNAWAEDFCAVQNGTREHSRHGHPPLEVWCRICPEQLREAPDRQTFFGLASGAHRTGTLTARGWLRADGKVWQIRGARLHTGQKVAFRLLPFVDEGIRVWDLRGNELAAQAIPFDDAGFPAAGAHRHVWDPETPEEAGSTIPLTAGQDIAARVAAGEVEVRLPGVFDFAADLERQVFLSASGSTWSAPPEAEPLLGTPLLGRVEALERLSAQLGRWLDDDEIETLGAAIGEGCTEADLPELLATLHQPEAAVGGRRIR